jgi:uncharacterized membrane protein
VSGGSPPTPNGRPWSGDNVSTNGAAARKRNDAGLRLVVLGYILAIALPVFGFVFGVVVATRPNKAISKHAIWIIGLSVVGSILWVLVFTSGLLTSTNNDLGGY